MGGWDYDATVRLLTDLAEISRRRGRTTKFGDWDEWPSLAALTGVRAELAAGGLRPLYLALLAGAYYIDDEYEGGPADDDAVEPPVPAGLAQLTAAQRTLADS